MFSRNSNDKNSVIQKKDAYNDVTYKYLQKIDNQRKKLIILRKDYTENYKTLKEECTNENNGLTMIDTLL